MEPKIVRKSTFTVVGIEITTTANTFAADVSRLWTDVTSQGIDRAIQQPIDSNLTLAFIRNWSDTEPFSYFLGLEVRQAENIPDGCIAQQIDEATYVVFDLLGQGSAVTEPWPAINAWLESTGNTWVIPMNFREYNEVTQRGQIYVPIAAGEG